MYVLMMTAIASAGQRRCLLCIADEAVPVRNESQIVCKGLTKLMAL